MSETGHNSEGQLRSIVERIENVESEVKELNKCKAEIYLEAKSNGLDVKVLREIVRLRKMSEDDRSEREAILDTYKQALGMLA
jgi:uncharacterized protein (UPF0335 family)